MSKKVKITAWVDGRTASVIRGLAAQREESVSEVCARMLRRGVEEDAGGGIGAEVILPQVRASVRREVGRMGDRLAHLMARSALESATGRRLLFQLLAEEIGREDANQRNRSAWSASVESLRKPAEGLREILRERDGASSVADDASAEAGGAAADGESS